MKLKSERLLANARRIATSPDPLAGSPMGSPREGANEARMKRVELAQIDESLANPVESGPEWDRRRADLNRRADVIRDWLRSHGATIHSPRRP